MNKLVYLFELDSVRITDKQMELAMKALTREILVYGNTVVITYNQLVDSRFFLSLLNDDRWAEDILKLFRLGKIKISQFGQIRTPSQYLLNSALNSSDEFIFSGLPIRSSQKSLIALAKRSLMYSDLTELSEYINGPRKKEERDELLREYTKDEEDGKIKIMPCKLDDEKKEDLLRDLYAALNLILRISNIQNAYNPAKDTGAIKIDLSLYGFFERVVKCVHPNIPEWVNAIATLTFIFDEEEEGGKKVLKDKNKRSEIKNRIYNKYNASDKSDMTRRAYSLAEAIIDLCYNYTCESSISNVSRHYDIDEFHDKAGSYETFVDDFLRRLAQYYGDGGCCASCFLTGETNDFKLYEFKNSWFCNLKRTVRLVEYTSAGFLKNAPTDKLYPYEYQLEEQRKTQHRRIILGFVNKVIWTIIYLASTLAIANINGFWESIIDHEVETGLFSIFPPIRLIAIVIPFLLVFDVIGTLFDFITKRLRLNIPSPGECLGNLISLVVDCISSLLMRHDTPYANDKNVGTQAIHREAVKKIDFISKNVSDYKKYRDEVIKKGTDSNKGVWMYIQSEQIPLLDVQDNEDMVRLTRIEELTGKTFGIAYRSPFHIMLVDPAIKSGFDAKTCTDNEIYAYERLVATKDGAGIVSVPVLRDENGKPKFVLIKQFRHAIRREQWNFPRGFGENGLSALKNTQKELYEEICAVLWDPEKQSEIRYNKEDPESSDDPTPALVELGRITTDSGSQCDTVAIVQAEVKSHAVPENHEAIIDSKEVDAEELRNMIMSHQIDDSFTIMAFALWSYRNGYDQNVVK